MCSRATATIAAARARLRRVPGATTSPTEPSSSAPASTRDGCPARSVRPCAPTLAATERLSPTQLQQLARLSGATRACGSSARSPTLFLRAGRGDAAEETEAHPVLSAIEFSRW
ncbi:MAG: hypothetical protein U0325_20180 [Polyangiales bacterium]